MPLFWSRLGENREMNWRFVQPGKLQRGVRRGPCARLAHRMCVACDEVVTHRASPRPVIDGYEMPRLA